MIAFISTLSEEKVRPGVQFISIKEMFLFVSLLKLTNRNRGGGGGLSNYA